MAANHRNLIFISFSQFASNFSFNFIGVFLPFFIIKISPYSSQHTLLWVGVIMGSGSLCSAITSTFWGSLTHRFSPKMLYLRALLANAILFLLMGFSTSLHVLLILRMLQGLFGGASTTGMIIVSSSATKNRVSSDIGFFQSFMTLGQLSGPLIGSVGVVLLGYRGAFISASVILFASLVFCHLYVMDVPRLPKKDKTSGGTTLDKRILIAWVICFAAMIQLTFLPSVLPNVFETFNIEQTTAVKLAGIVVMLYTTTSMIGTYLWSRLSRKIGQYRMITSLLTLGIILQALLVFSQGITDFTVIRMLQTGLVAATFPLVISIFAGESKGGVIGFLNSSRFAGSAMGPIIATSILAYFNLTTLYFFISGLTLLALLGFRAFFRQPNVVSC
jgi:DHA1 family multidrug resistance protein-like MFS transporter